MKVLNLLASGHHGGIETLCNNIDKYSKIQNFWIFLFDDGEIANEMKSRNPNSVYILKYSKCSFFKFIKRIIEICEENKIDIINIHHGGTYCNLLFTYLKKCNRNIKFVRSFHSCYEEKFNLSKNIVKNKIYIYYLNKALKISDLMVFVSNAVMESYEKKFNLQSKNKAVIYNGIDNIYLNNYNINYNKERKNHLIYVGRLEKVKGIEILLDAFCLLCENNKIVDLTIVGTGSQYEKLKERCSCLNIKDRVFFEGERNDIIKYLDKSDIFIYPSIWKEAFGISVVEAMARGCIPITFDRGGLPEIIENGKNGFLVTNISAIHLADSIQNVINIKEEEKMIIINNANRTAEKFTINKTIKELEDEYNKTLNTYND